MCIRDSVGTGDIRLRLVIIEIGNVVIHQMCIRDSLYSRGLEGWYAEFPEIIHKRAEESALKWPTQKPLAREDVYKRQGLHKPEGKPFAGSGVMDLRRNLRRALEEKGTARPVYFLARSALLLSLIHI